ncbi:MAG: hypothetical protein MHPSP_003632, partial [Paramarteilia canceri]
GQQEIIQEQEKLKSLKQNKQPETNPGWFESFLPKFGMSSTETGNNNNSIH